MRNGHGRAPIVDAGLGDPTGWRAELTLDFEKTGTQTVLARRQHIGPMLVQRPLYPEGSTCHVYLVHPPGGVVGGDTISVNIACQEGTEVLLTTPAAGKFYRSNGKIATQSLRFIALEGAVLEWLPQETILFDDSRVKCLTRFDLKDGSCLIGWDIVCLGRPACGESFDHGEADISLEIWKQNKPLLVERMVLNSGSVSSRCGLNGHSLTATMVAYPADQQKLEAVREIAGGNGFFGATLIDDLLVCRMLGVQAEPVRALFTNLWTALRPGLTQRVACQPRVWAT